MKKVYVFLFLFTSLVMYGCPTCIGRITKDSPPFFSDEFYATTTENMDELYQTIVQSEQAIMSSAENTQIEKEKQ